MHFLINILTVTWLSVRSDPDFQAASESLPLSEAQLSMPYGFLSYEPLAKHISHAFCHDAFDSYLIVFEV